MSPGRTCKAIQLACRLNASRSTLVSTSVHCALNPRDPHSRTQTNRGVWGAQRASPSGRRPAGGQRAKPPITNKTVHCAHRCPQSKGPAFTHADKPGVWGAQRASPSGRRPAGGQRAKPPITNKASSRSALVRARSERPIQRVRPQPEVSLLLPSERLHGIQFCRLKRRDKPEDQTDRRARRERDDQRGR